MMGLFWPYGHTHGPVEIQSEEKNPGYDTGEPRRFQFIPFWGIAVVLLYAMRRVNCPLCQIKVERVPWSEGKTGMTKAYQWFLAHWAKRLSWQEVAEAFGSTWYHVYGSVEMAVEWGRKHMNLEGNTAIGVDEMETGSSVRDGGLSNRCGIQTAVVDRGEEKEQNAVKIFPVAGGG